VTITVLCRHGTRLLTVHVGGVYCSFMWQMCSYIPTTLPRSDSEQRVSVMAAKLSASFILETLIHSKEKVGIMMTSSQRLLTKCHIVAVYFP